MIPILSTKLYSPQLRATTILRPALVDKLLAGIHENRKLTLVSAPAGYGKTTLIVELLQALKETSVWISLDDSDNDLIQFLSYVIVGLQRSGITIDPHTEGLVGDLNLSSTKAPLNHLLNDLSKASEKIILVLDDFHLINSSQINDALQYLIEHQPPNFHLVIITRTDPQLQISRLRVERKIVEIRRDELSFTKIETEFFLHNSMNLKINEQALETIMTRTEGWIASLQLAALTLNSYEEQDASEFIKVFKDSHTYIIDYLVEEVLHHQTPEIRDFLCKTSILDRMNTELCDAILDKNNSEKQLVALDRANLFLIPLDSKREWYRYHHLFADSVRSELSKQEQQKLNRKASLWFDSNGFPQEAIKHAFQAGDLQLALNLVEGQTEQAFKSAQLLNFLKWLNKFPDVLIKESEILSVRKAWVLFILGNVPEALHYMDTLDEAFQENLTAHNKGLLLSLKALIAQYMGKDNCEALALEAITLLEPWDPISRISTLNTLGKAQKDHGKLEEARKTFEAAYQEGLKIGYTFITTLALYNLGSCLSLLNQSPKAIALYLDYIDQMTLKHQNVLPFIGVIYIGLAQEYIKKHEYEPANSYLEKGATLCESIDYHWLDPIILELKENLAQPKKSQMSSPPIELLEKLSPREMDILILLSKGMSNDEIAQTLFITLNTTQWHTSHIYAKLDVKNRTQAVIKAKELHIL